MMTPEDLAAIRERAGKATRQDHMAEIVAKVRREWPEVSGYRVLEVRDHGMTATLIDHAVLVAMQAENPTFAAMHADIAALLAEVERLRGERDEATRAHNLAADRFMDVTATANRLQARLDKVRAVVEKHRPDDYTWGIGEDILEALDGSDQ